MEIYLPKIMDFYLPKSMDFSLPFTWHLKGLGVSFIVDLFP
jgi:hypothetical protein